MKTLSTRDWNERDNYLLEPRPLATGGQAEIFLATFKPTGEVFAFKKMDQYSRKRSETEIKVIQELAVFDCKNIINLIGYDDRNYSWYVMPLARYSLRDKIMEIDIPALVSLVHDLCHALAVAHGAGVIHRDIKPENILFFQHGEQQRRWCLADWGLARLPEGETLVHQTRAGIGTPGYTAPEVWLSPHKVDGRADLYSLGKVIEEALLRSGEADEESAEGLGRWAELIRRATHENRELRLPDTAALLALMEAASREDEPRVWETAAAVETLHQLAERMRAAGAEEAQLRLFLMRFVFCVFASAMKMFPDNGLLTLLQHRPAADYNMIINYAFLLMNTPGERPLHTLKELERLPYVNGDLFSQGQGLLIFDDETRALVLRAFDHPWSEMSPDIFGALLQFYMSPGDRRGQGVHYTKEKDILKTINPLFMNDLKQQFFYVKTLKNKVKRIAALHQLHEEIAKITILDPACGCGNFLIVSYRELRRLELDVLRALYDQGSGLLDIKTHTKVRIKSMFGIELDDFSAQIAKICLWLVDHQMDREVARAFGQTFVRLPITEAASIDRGDAIDLPWPTVDYIVGNPPFISKNNANKKQKEDLRRLTGGLRLDYVALWYIKAAQAIDQSPQQKTRAAFVSTSSLTQGEQPPLLWALIRDQVQLCFAYQPFSWKDPVKPQDKKDTNDADDADVHVVVTGLASLNSTLDKYIFNEKNGVTSKKKTNMISPYLTMSDFFLVKDRDTPISNVPDIHYGNKPVGKDLLIDSINEINNNKVVEKWLRPLISAKKFIHGKHRWCLWLHDAQDSEILSNPMTAERVARVATERRKSSKTATRALADAPHLFGEIRVFDKPGLVIPSHASAHRDFIPMDFVDARCIVDNSCFIIPDAEVFHFGVLHSRMHMLWVKTICGRIRDDYRYSASIVYNNFPWPEPSPDDKALICAAAQALLDARRASPSLASTYDDTTLINLQRLLDDAVDLAYGLKPRARDQERLELLVSRFLALTSPSAAP